jgi:hypothetical protein
MISKRCCLETKIAQCCYLKSSPYNACCKKDAEVVGHKNIRLTRRCACTFLCIRIEAVQASDIPVVTMLTCFYPSRKHSTLKSTSSIILCCGRKKNTLPASFRFIILPFLSIQSRHLYKTLVSTPSL